MPESEKVLETSSEESKKKHDKLVNKLLWLTLIIFFTVFVLYPYVAINTKSPWVSNKTFSFDVYKPYTFNHYNAEEDDDYEFDCYKLSSKVISKIKENPLRYIIYNQKKYEMDDHAVDYFDLDLATQDGFLNEYYGITNNIIRNYNAIIFWNNYDGKYHHFDSVMILDGAESFILYKYIDFSNFNYVFVRDNDSVHIIRKVKKITRESFESKVFSRNAKYGLTDEEVAFIECMIRPMSEA